MLREEVKRWQKSYTIANNGVDPARVPTSNLDMDGEGVHKVLENKFGKLDSMEYEGFKELESEQEDRLKKFYNASIQKQETLKKSQVLSDREKEKQWFNENQAAIEKKYDVYSGRTKEY